jgi:subtilisin family serine protease
MARFLGRMIGWSCLFLLISGTAVCIAESGTKPDGTVVGPGVEAAFSTNHYARVLIKLRGIAKTGQDHPDMAGIRLLHSHFQERLVEARQRGEFRQIRQMNAIPWLSARISRAVLNKIRTYKGVAAIEADVPIYARLSESVPQIGADRAWDYGTTGTGITVAVLDSGIDTDHPDLVDSLVREECFLSDGFCPVTGTDRSSGPGSAEDGDGHGTHVSGIITSDNATWRGVAPAAGIVAIKILDDSGGGYLSDLVAALDWVAENHDTYQIRVVNMSLGSYVYDGICDGDHPSIAEAAEAVKEEGIVLFAAAGNEKEISAIDMPACLSSVISVGAVYDDDVGSPSYSGTCSESYTDADQIVCFSNVSTVLDMLAPGARITSSRVGGGTTGQSGTSMATPHAAGAAALLLEANADLTPDDLLSLMTGTGLPIYDDRIDIWFPRVDAATAVGYALSDMDTDGDVDGADLACLAGTSGHGELEAFASTFGLVR